MPNFTAAEPMGSLRRCSAKDVDGIENMIGKIVAAEVGRRLAGRDNGIKGALIGAAAPWLVRRAFTPAGIAIIGAFAAKTIYDNKRERDRKVAVRLDGVTRAGRAEPAVVTSEPAVQTAS
jgi:hypothetical protein